jgi:hypothetical protein
MCSTICQSSFVSLLLTRTSKASVCRPIPQTVGEFKENNRREDFSVSTRIQTGERKLEMEVWKILAEQRMMLQKLLESRLHSECH